MPSSKRHPALPKSITLTGRWRRHAWLAVALAAAVALSLLDQAGQPASTGDDWAKYHDRSCKVVRVVDGDTIIIDVPDHDKPVTRVRLWGVDAPETARHGRPESYFGAEAKAYTARRLEGRTVHLALSTKRTRGKYDRLLAYLYLERGGRMFNEMLLREGYAYADLRFDHHYYRSFRDIEKRARRDGAGLWADVTPARMPAWRQRFEKAAAQTGG
jgi:micrococcal nuclease